MKARGNVTILDRQVTPDCREVERLKKGYASTVDAINALSNRQHELYIRRGREIANGEVTSYGEGCLDEDPWAQEVAAIRQALRELWDERRRELRERNDLTPTLGMKDTSEIDVSGMESSSDLPTKRGPYRMKLEDVKSL